MNGQQDLIIFHYHLLPGGVTDVIRLSLQAFCGDPSFRSITVVCGRDAHIDRMEAHFRLLRESAPGPLPALEIAVLPALDYLDSEGAAEEEPGSLKMLLMERFGGEDSLWLIHNYHLGKNWHFTKALLSLAEEGRQKMILQIHDFPECGRFNNLKVLKERITGSLYTRAPSVRYCVINKRDYDLLIRAGLEESRLFLLENPLAEGKGAPQSDPAGRAALISTLSAYAPAEGIFHKNGEVWLYPVRSIRRKNVLEGGLILRLLEKPVNLVVTLPGISPQEKGYSDMVQQAYAEGLIPGFWGTGLLPEESGIGYQDMIRHADCIFSSSIQEGFGYMYLNAILWNKPLIARYLDIMGGFLPLFDSYPSHFYKALRIPGKKPQKESLRREYLERFEAIRPRLDQEIRESLIRELEQFLDQEGIDFSYLSSLDQYSALQTLAGDKGYRKACRALNDPLISALSKIGKPDDPSFRSRVFDHYGMESYRQAFRKITDSFDRKLPAGTGDAAGKVDRELLQGFSRLEYMRLLYG